MPKAFTFDLVFDWNSTQEEIFTLCAQPIVSSVLEGYNGTIFAYGQTGTGKTHTMEGPNLGDQRGIIPRTFQYIFDEIQDPKESQQFLVRASYLEIYNEEVRDLLAKDPKNKLELRCAVASRAAIMCCSVFFFVWVCVARGARRARGCAGTADALAA